jgi:hypothetical protein
VHDGRGAAVASGGELTSAVAATSKDRVRLEGCWGDSSWWL